MSDFENFLQKKNKFAQPTLPVPVLELAFPFPVIRHSGRHVEARRGARSARPAAQL